MGAQGGGLNTVKWGEWEELHRLDMSTHKLSVDAIVPYNHNTVITACSDSLIRY